MLPLTPRSTSLEATCSGCSLKRRDTLAAVRLYHADKLSTSLKPPLTVRKHTSSKRTLSYQASQAARKVSRALRESDACHTLEVPGQPLQRCAGCKAVEYCSSKSQKPSLDWKTGHKLACNAMAAAGKK